MNLLHCHKLSYFYLKITGDYKKNIAVCKDIAFGGHIYVFLRNKRRGIL